MRKKPVQITPNRMIVLAIAALLLPAVHGFAEPTTYRNGGLKNETIVTLDVTGKTATGTFVTYEYGAEIPPATPFTGKVVLTPKGKRGLFLEISFAGPRPYSVPAETKTLLWHLKTVKGQTHLFIPMQQRSYDTTPPKSIVADVELEPDSD